ncbi:50S ribosomal protein L25/general stress protein Ctc, partial [Actinotignum timonense]|nr:50S ribosomal protein L25/general stress protein Ctc [Actinotignum timonense]
DGRVPAVLYGHGIEPVHVHLDAHDLFLAVKGNPNALVSLTIDGELTLALVKDIQRNPLSRSIEHVDFLRVKRDEKVEVEIPVVVVGEPAPGLINTLELLNILVSAPAIDIPESIEVNVEGLEDGARVTVADLKLPEDVEALVDGEEIVSLVMEPQVDKALEEADAAMAEAQAEEAAEEAAASEGAGE